MRKITKLIAAVLIGVSMQSTVSAQMVSYKTVKDDPKDVANFIISVDPIAMDVAFKNLGGSGLLGLGANGYATLFGRLGADVNFRFGYLVLDIKGQEGVHKPMWFDAGGFFNLTDKTKTRMAKVVLSSHTVGNTTYTKSITVPANRRRLLGVRGGIITHTFPYNGDDGKYTIKGRSDGYESGYINSSVSGIYAGAQITTIRNLFVNTDGYGVCSNTGVTRTYFDFMILPAYTARYDGKSYKDSIFAGGPGGTATTEKLKYNPIGWRFGLDFHPAETRRRKSEGRARGIYIKMEFGKRPVEGVFLMMGCGFTVMRKKMTVLGYKKPASEQNTFE